jgi:hypothetical protein
MKRLAAVAVMLVWFSCEMLAQRGGSRGAMSGSHAGFSAPSGGFSSRSAPAFRGAPAIHSAPIFRGGPSAPRGGFSRPVAPRSVGPARLTPRPSPNPVRAHPVRSGPRIPSDPRMSAGGSGSTYHSRYGGNDHHNRHHHPHNRVVYVNSVWPVWAYPYGWGYPYIWPSIFNEPDDYDSQQPASNYAVAQPSDYGNIPYPAQAEDQPQPAPRELYRQQPNAFEHSPSNAGRQPLPAAETPVTLVFKDGRPTEQIHNYLLTPTTLTVLDRHRRDIPVDEIDLNATTRVNLQAGLDFSLPDRSR